MLNQDNKMCFLLNYNSGKEWYSPELDERFYSALNNKRPEAFAILYKKLFPLIFNFAKRFVTVEEAEDITAETFYKAWKLEKEFWSLPSIKIYLQVTAKNACMDCLERNQRQSKAKQYFLVHSDRKTDEADNIKELQFLKLNFILSEIEKLPPQQRKIIKYHFIDKLKGKEIAAMMNIRINSIRTQKMRALKKIRLALLAHDPLIMIFILSLVESII